MRKISRDKKAISMIISYVLLIVIALGLSGGVFVWLKVYVPKAKLECSEGISLIIKEYNCNPEVGAGKVSITFQNKGLHDIDGAYIKIANEAERTPSLELLPVDESEGSLGDLPSEKGFFYFGLNGLRPERDPITQLFDYSEHGNIERVSIEPFVVDSDTEEIIICSKAARTQRLECS